MTIHAHHDLDGSTLMATSHGYTAVAGPRLFRAAPHPDIRFTHSDPDVAEKDSATLQAYLDALAPRKGKKKSTATGAFSE